MFVLCRTHKVTCLGKLLLNLSPFFLEKSGEARGPDLLQPNLADLEQFRTAEEAAYWIQRNWIGTFAGRSGLAADYDWRAVPLDDLKSSLWSNSSRQLQDLVLAHPTICVS
jgi:hypothetical protein